MHLKLVIPQSILISIQCWLLKCSYRRPKVTPTKSNWDHAVHRILRCIWKSLPISAKLFVQRAGQLTCRSRLVEYEAESTNKRRLGSKTFPLGPEDAISCQEGISCRQLFIASYSAIVNRSIPRKQKCIRSSERTASSTSIIITEGWNRN